jgi:hypothetical protein
MSVDGRSPRASVSSAGGEESDFVTARTHASEDGVASGVVTDRLPADTTARSAYYSDDDDDDRDAFYSTREAVGASNQAVPMPFMAAGGEDGQGARMPALPAYSITFEAAQRASGGPPRRACACGCVTVVYYCSA